MPTPEIFAPRWPLVAALAALLWAGAAVSQETGLRVLARGGPGEEPVEVASGAALRTGDEILVRVTTAVEAYVYVVAYGSSGTALLLHPFSGDDDEALLPAGEHALPEPDLYLPLDAREGTELIVAFASAEPVADIGRLLERMESRRGDTRAVVGEVRKEHPGAGAIAFRHVGAEATAPDAPASTARGAQGASQGTTRSAGAPATSQGAGAPGAPDMDALMGGLPPGPGESARAGEPGVLGASGSRIQALIEGRSIERAAPEARPLELPEPAAEPASESAEQREPAGGKESLGKRLGRLFGLGRKREAQPEASEDEPEPQDPAPEPRSEAEPARTFAIAGADAGARGLRLEPLPGDSTATGEADREAAAVDPAQSESSPTAADASAAQPSVGPAPAAPGGDRAADLDVAGSGADPSLPEGSPAPEEERVADARGGGSGVDSPSVISPRSRGGDGAAAASGAAAGSSPGTPRRGTDSAQSAGEVAEDPESSATLLARLFASDAERAAQGSREEAAKEASSARQPERLAAPAASAGEATARAADEPSAARSRTPAARATRELEPQPPATPTAPAKAQIQPSLPADVEDVAASVVLVVAATGSGAGVVVDTAGRVLTNWHTVRGAGSATVVLAGTAAGDRPRRRAARVVRVNRFSDLALLELTEPPDDLSPVPFAERSKAEPGAAVHTVGHAAAGEPTLAAGRLATVRRGSAWYSGNRVLHRATLLRAEMLADPGAAGAPMLDADGKVLGVTTRAERNKGVVSAIAVDTIRAFLGEPSPPPG